MMSSRDLLRPISSDHFVPSQSDPFETTYDYDEDESRELFSTPTIEELTEMNIQPSLPSQSESSQPILKTPNNSQSQDSVEKVAINSVRRLRFRDTIEERTISEVDTDEDSMEIDQPSQEAEKPGLDQPSQEAVLDESIYLSPNASLDSNDKTVEEDTIVEIQEKESENEEKVEDDLKPMVDQQEEILSDDMNELQVKPVFG